MSGPLYAFTCPVTLLEWWRNELHYLPTRFEFCGKILLTLLPRIDTPGVIERVSTLFQGNPGPEHVCNCCPASCLLRSATGELVAILNNPATALLQLICYEPEHLGNKSGEIFNLTTLSQGFYEA